MTNNTDALSSALNALLTKASKGPSKAARYASAQSNLKKAKDCRKGAEKAIKAAHGILKAAYLSKMAKAGKKPGDPVDQDDADIQSAMEKMQKAFGELNKLGTFTKKASMQLKKAAQTGTSPSDGNANYMPPQGITPLSVQDVAGAGPGGDQRGSQPPLYPTDGTTYAGKGADVFDLRKYANKDGMVPAGIAELVAAASANSGELEALRRQPSGRSRPVAFDLTKIGGNSYGGQPADTRELFKGVDVSKLGGEESEHVAEAAKYIGNFLTSGTQGRSIMDPAFKGAAVGRG